MYFVRKCLKRCSHVSLFEVSSTPTNIRLSLMLRYLRSTTLSCKLKLLCLSAATSDSRDLFVVTRVTTFFEQFV